MATFAIESNGLLETTAVYYNGKQIGGLKEIFISLDEDGAFDTIIQYEGTDKQLYTKDIFNDYMDKIKVVEPSFTEEEAEELYLFVIESDGTIEQTYIYENDEPDPLEGIVSVYIHIKASETKSGIKSYFKRDSLPDHPEFRAEITFREEDGTTTMESIF